MMKTALSFALLALAPLLASAFAPVPMTSPVTAVRRHTNSPRLAATDDRKRDLELGMNMPKKGVSVDQDGKQNIWPTNVAAGEVEEQSGVKLGIIAALGGAIAFALVAGSFLLIPDPDL